VEVVAVSQTVPLDPPVCEYCGEFIEDEDQLCPACDDGSLCYP
jgi:predicted amidophosphoribosyltransferase